MSVLVRVDFVSVISLFSPRLVVLLVTSSSSFHTWLRALVIQRPDHCNLCSISLTWAWLASPLQCVKSVPYSAVSSNHELNSSASLCFLCSPSFARRWTLNFLPDTLICVPELDRSPGFYLLLHITLLALCYCAFSNKSFSALPSLSAFASSPMSFYFCFYPI